MNLASGTPYHSTQPNAAEFPRAGSHRLVNCASLDAESPNELPPDLDQQRHYGSGVSAPVAGSIRKLETVESSKCATESPVPSGLTSMLEGLAAAANCEPTTAFSSPVFQLMLKADTLPEV